MAATMNGGAWSYAVPLEESDGNTRHAARADVEKDVQSVSRRSSAWDLQSDSEQAKQRRTSLRASNTTAGRKRSRNQLREKRPGDASPAERVDDSAWIHRDKLAQIEIQELAEAGIYVRQPRRSESAGPARESGRSSRSVSRSRRPASRTSQERQKEIIQDDDYSAAYPMHEQDLPRKRVSTVISTPEEEYAEDETAQSHEPAYAEGHFDAARDSEFRSPAEVAREQHQPQRPQAGTTRPGTSRIPVSRVSPVPIPQNVVERDSPLPRSRAGSQNWSGSFDEMQYARKARSGSVGSQALLDSDPDASRKTHPGTSSRKVSNEENSAPTENAPKKSMSGARKTSAPVTTTSRPGSSHQNKRVVSAGTAKRPGSSSGLRSRPPTSQYPPEGEAPWISTMYKPDPRLPPDQQMLPTHKKRLLQEQWEKEGKSGTVYDRDFNLLNDEVPKRKPPGLALEDHSPEPAHYESPNKENHPPTLESPGRGPWPLSPAKSAASETSVRPGTSGGYKITPTIPSTPTIQRSPGLSPAPPPTFPSYNATPRVPELDEKQEAQPKKGCCCVVM